MFKINLMPQDKKFFDLFNKLSNVLVKISEEFILFLENYQNQNTYVEQINKLEDEGNSLADELMKELLSTFVTPLDREDIHSLTKLLASIVNHVHSVTRYFDLYNIKEVNDNVINLAKTLKSCSQELSLLISRLNNMSELGKISPHIDEIHKLEYQGDKIFRNSIKDLFTNDYEALYVIKWKDIYNRIENAIDKCNDSANVILGIILKYA
ncbi:MAG: hypothetical protein KatS3mg068_1450 [Candidatus Sericytochromatia bacterium]|nr:MAG: hypothetical protein KatS3mg068_1450 [Candidatus Sericytochromatia bacterium]